MSASDWLTCWVFWLWQSGRITAAEAVQAGEMLGQLRAMEQGLPSIQAMVQAASARESVVSPKLVQSEPPPVCGRSNFLRHDWFSAEGRPPGSRPSKVQEKVERERVLWTAPLDRVLAERRAAQAA